MINVQLKDNCWLCLGLQPDCVTCDGTGEVTTWVQLDDLVDQIEGIQKRKKEREEFFAPMEPPTDFRMEDLDIPPNLNI